MFACVCESISGWVAMLLCVLLYRTLDLINFVQKKYNTNKKVAGMKI